MEAETLHLLATRRGECGPILPGFAPRDLWLGFHRAAHQAASVIIDEEARVDDVSPIGRARFESGREPLAWINESVTACGRQHCQSKHNRGDGDA
jgi:hypothetical protein